MPIAGALIGVAGSIGGALLSSSASKKAGQTQANSDAAALAQQQAQWSATRASEQPFISAGTNALGQYGDLLGTNGGAPQSAAITALQNSPYYQSLYRNGLEANLQNASATGGIRGGNEARSLANFGSDTLAQTIQQQLANLGGLASMGANTAAGLGNLGQANANAQSGLLQSSGMAQAGGILGSQAAINSGLNGAFSALSPYLKSLNSGSFGGLFGGGTPLGASGPLSGAFVNQAAINSAQIPELF